VTHVPEMPSDCGQPADHGPSLLCSADEYYYLTHCYQQLLRMPHGAVRVHIQSALSALRDEIARVSQRDGEDVQNTFEANNLRLWGFPS
jgi:hypothetical protein